MIAGGDTPCHAYIDSRPVNDAGATRPANRHADGTAAPSPHGPLQQLPAFRKRHVIKADALLEHAHEIIADDQRTGDSRLVFAVAVEKGSNIRRKALGTGVIDVYSASGREYRAKNLGNVPRKVIGHYTGLPGWDDAMDACYSAFEANGTL